LKISLREKQLRMLASNGAMALPATVHGPISGAFAVWLEHEK